MTFHRDGTVTFLKSRFTRIVIPFVLGWFVLRPLVVSGWVMGYASLQGSVDVVSGLKAGFQSLGSLPTGIFTGTHLWFLYYLVLITAGTLLVRYLISCFPPIYLQLVAVSDSVAAWIANAKGSLFVLALPISLLIWNMQGWGVDTPDKTLVPHLPVLAIYGGFFILGWVLHRNQEWISWFARLSSLTVLTALVSIGTTLTLSSFQLDTSHPSFHLAHVGYVYSYSLMMGSLVSITLGVFKRICSQPNRVVRYFADASYWLYLVHLPIVVWLQVAFAELAMHWTLKLVAISFLTVAISLLLYDLFVRSTFIGKTLNGRTHRRMLPA